jgi:hypothetical protein
MSSVTRSFANNTRLPYPFPVHVMTYGDGGDYNQVVPLTYDKKTGVLDFDFSGTFSANEEIFGNTAYVQGASFNAVRQVTDIGPNIVDWCETTGGADEGSVVIHEKPIIVRTNQIAIGREPNSSGTMSESDTPFDFEYASGNAANNFNATFLFKKPLVVKYTEASVVKYRMFNSQFEGNT